MRFCPRYIETVVDGVRTLICDPSIPVNKWTILGMRVFLVFLGALFVYLALRLLVRIYRKGLTWAEFSHWWRTFVIGSGK